VSGDASSNDLSRDAGTPPSGLRGFGDAGVGKIGMWVFLGTDAMGFGALLLAYAVLRTRATAWPDPAMRFDRPLAAILTFVLLGSGATMTAAVAAARDGRQRAARVFIALTALAGVGFVAGQIVEFHALATTRQLGLTADHAAALFYVITGYHGLHVVVGVVVLIAVGARWLRREHQQPAPGSSVSSGAVAPEIPEPAAGALAVAGLYWQFVDLVWIVIFTALYLLPPVIHG
jgi:heme/copper-type cytochrome/quinol oxidase subunit 3